MASYINERLEIGIIYETVGSPVGWDTTIINRDNGFYLPIERQFDSIGRWNIGDRRFSKKEWEYLLAFFYNVRGSAIAFKYKDWSDYQAINQPIADADGTETQFQLIKTYGDYFKPIYKPVAGTVKIYLDGVLQTSGYTVNSVGIITFATAPDAGVAIAADFEFDLVVRFENDTLTSRFDAYDPNHTEEALYNVPSIFLIEVLPIDSNTFSQDRWIYQDGVCIVDISGPYGSQAECEAENLRWKCENGVCVQDPTGPYNSQNECENALVPANFTGGQCTTTYNFTGTFRITTQTGDSIERFTFNFVGLTGPIVSFVVDPFFQIGNSFRFSYTITDATGLTFSGIESAGSVFDPLASRPAVGSVATIFSGGAVRADGLPDDCGNPPASCP